MISVFSSSIATHLVCDLHNFFVPLFPNSQVRNAIMHKHRVMVWYILIKTFGDLLKRHGIW